MATCVGAGSISVGSNLAKRAQCGVIQCLKHLQTFMKPKNPVPHTVHITFYQIFPHKVCKH